MAGSTTKKVQILRFDRDTLTGFVNPLTYLTDSGIELLTLGGNVIVANYTEVKAVFFVREFDVIDFRASFLSRPKLDGLWLRLTFRDGDIREAVMPNNLLHVEPHGFNLIPPETTQRIWVPREALTAVQVLGVIGVRAATASKRSKGAAQDQIGMFEQP
jgi:hypothetical protein